MGEVIAWGFAGMFLACGLIAAGLVREMAAKQKHDESFTEIEPHRSEN